MKHKILLNSAQELVKLPAVLVFLLAFGIYGCSSTKIGSNAVANYNNNPLTVMVPSGLSSEFIENAMKETLINRKWVIRSHSQNEAVASLVHRGYDATVTLQSDGSIITILNEATFKDLNSGEITPAVPMGWLVNIQKDLQSKLSSAQ